MRPAPGLTSPRATKYITKKAVTDSKQLRTVRHIMNRKPSEGPKPSVTGVLGAKAGWRVPPTQHLHRGGHTPQLPLQLTPDPVRDSFHPGSEQGTCLFLLPPAAAGAPVKPGLSFSSGLRPFLWIGEDQAHRLVIAGGLRPAGSVLDCVPNHPCKDSLTSQLMEMPSDPPGHL